RRARRGRPARDRLRPAAPLLRCHRRPGQPPVALPDRLPRREPPAVERPHRRLRGGGRPPGAGADRPGVRGHRGGGVPARNDVVTTTPAVGATPAAGTTPAVVTAPAEGLLLVGHGSRSDAG